MLKVASVVEAVKCLEEFKKLVQVMIEFSFWLNDFIRRLLENYCFVPLANKAPPQISDNRHCSPIHYINSEILEISFRQHFAFLWRFMPFILFPEWFRTIKRPFLSKKSRQSIPILVSANDYSTHPCLGLLKKLRRYNFRACRFHVWVILEPSCRRQQF